MKSKLLMLAGVAGILIASPSTDALADVSVRIGTGGHHRSAFVIDRPPRFVRLATPGFSIAIGSSPYDIILSGNFYYLYNHGHWYRSHRYNGPWKKIHHRKLPYRIRRYRIDQIRKFRAVENNRWRDRYEHRYRRFERRDDRRDDRRDRRDDRRFDRRDDWPMHRR